MSGLSTAPLAVLFDLDGTLVDSAPDLAAAANHVRQYQGLAALDIAQYRPATGAGARGMLRVALGIAPEDAGYEALRTLFLDAYEACLTRSTSVFPALRPVLDRLDDNGVPWGIVTNKSQRFALPLTKALGLSERAATLVCGDTTPHPKPHPAPLLEAARQLGMAAGACIYVGDDLRDIQAGRAAGMRTVAAAWGYLGEGQDVRDWGADLCIDLPGDLLKLLSLP